MFLALAAAFYLQENVKFKEWVKPVVTFGSAALFFYCAHLVIYGAFPFLFGLEKSFSLVVTLVVWILGLLILYPACIEFQKLKKRYPESPLKFI
jgi:hypothetical protein